MEKAFKKLLQGYTQFRKKYAQDDDSIMQQLSYHGQKPEIMVVACSDSRVDPALILQCEPGDLFIVRNVANIIPPYEKDAGYHGTSAALEFGICYLHVKHLIILGHSQCGGMQALLQGETLTQNDFISHWVSTVNKAVDESIEQTTKNALIVSHQHCLSFPWIKQRVDKQALKIHLWLFDIEKGQISTCDLATKKYKPLSSESPL